MKSISKKCLECGKKLTEKDKRFRYYHDSCVTKTEIISEMIKDKTVLLTGTKKYTLLVLPSLVVYLSQPLREISYLIPLGIYFIVIIFGIFFSNYYWLDADMMKFAISKYDETEVVKHGKE